MTAAEAPVLLALAGLPGVGKSTVARLVAARLGAAYLRIDTIEQALRTLDTLPAGVVIEGYAVAYGLAAENLRLGRPVVADGVNPLGVTRDAWRAVAAAAGARLVDVEVVCADAAEHRRRVEARRAAGSDVLGLTPPDWDAVQRHAYDAWDRPRLVLDTAGRNPDACAAELLPHLAPEVLTSAPDTPG